MAFTFITPIRLGLKFDPASIVLVYRDKSKLRNRSIPAKNLDILSNITLYVEQFKNNPKNKKFFEKISENKLEKMFFILQDNMKGYTLNESLFETLKFSHVHTDKTNDLKMDEIKSVKSNFYDFEDEVEDDIPDENNGGNDENESDSEILNFSRKPKKEDDEKIETAKSDDESSGSF
ncbi:centrosomal of 19 kDa [Brachionus plicatilis]|uniref:Centrosomal protein of 19 kDa n=1 Tax=Brachionus plicatilis TaxID=10195 RepID=A0A3M7TAF3_BRAPC|nr:centrosomal of 19 kDa [Brachionus plicatilis]